MLVGIPCLREGARVIADSDSCTVDPEAVQENTLEEWQESVVSYFVGVCQASFPKVLQHHAVPRMNPGPFLCKACTPDLRAVYTAFFIV